MKTDEGSPITLDERAGITGTDLHCTLYTGGEQTEEGCRRRLHIMRSIREERGKSGKVLQERNKAGDFRQNTDGQLYQQRRRQSIHNRRHCRGMGVRRKQSGSRAAGKPASASTARDRRKRFYEHTGRNRRRTAVFVKGGSRRTIKQRWRRHRAAQAAGKRNCNKTYRVV